MSEVIARLDLELEDEELDELLSELERDGYHHIKNQDLFNHIDRVGIVLFKKEVPDFTKH